MPSRFHLHLSISELKVASDLVDPPQPMLPSAFAMATDLLSAMQIPMLLRDGEGMVAEAVDVEETIHLIRRLQMLFQGFSDPLPGLVHARISVHAAEAGGRASGPGHDAYAGTPASPGAVLLCPEAYDEAQRIPGLRFKRVSVPGGMSPCWELLPPEWLAAGVRLPSTARGTGEADGAPTEAGKRADDRLLARIRAGGMVLSSRVLLLGKPLPGWALASCAGGAVVLLGSAMLAVRGHGKPHQLPVVADLPAAIHRPAAQPPVEVPAAAVAPVTRTAPGQSSDRSGAKQVVKNPAITVSPPPESEPGEHVGRGLSEEEIRLLLIKADKASGNGEYDKAITYYNYILRRDPRNAAAQRGLARAKQNRGG